MLWDQSLLISITIIAMVFTVACLYSSVGHGGASGYLAVLSFFAFDPKQMATTALILNILVASIALYYYYKAGYLDLKLSTPFFLSSIPAAFVGGALAIPNKTYYLLLAAILLFSAFRLAFFVNADMAPGDMKKPSFALMLIIGALIGLLSGLVGVGGGIFLSPIILLFKWADAKVTAATSALFIVVNSISGLIARFIFHDFVINTESGTLVIACLLGGLIGSHLGANKLTKNILCRLLAIVLLMAAVKLCFIIKT